MAAGHRNFVNMVVSIMLLQGASISEMASEYKWSVIIQSRLLQDQHLWPYADFHS
jgi:hypothetical protein